MAAAMIYLAQDRQLMLQRLKLRRSPMPCAFLRLVAPQRLRQRRDWRDRVLAEVQVLSATEHEWIAPHQAGLLSWARLQGQR